MKDNLIEKCKKFIQLFLDFIDSDRKYSDDELEKEAENVKQWVEDLADKTLEDKLNMLVVSINAIKDDIKNKKYKGKVFDQNSIPNRIKYYSWPNMLRINNI